MSLNIYKRDILVVNRVWMVLGTNTIKQGLITLNSQSGDEEAAKSFHVEYEYLGNDTWNFDKIINISTLDFEEWLKLPIYPYHNVIHTIRQSIIIPNVIMAVHCNRTHLRDVKLNVHNILERDNYTCQYSNKKLPRSKLNIDHVISRDEWKRRGLAGSPDTWTNMVACDKAINSKKSNKSNKEAGLELIREPKKPLSLPASSLIREIRHREWNIFLHK